jgi:hypothetical protein
MLCDIGKKKKQIIDNKTKLIANGVKKWSKNSELRFLKINFDMEVLKEEKIY